MSNLVTPFPEEFLGEGGAFPEAIQLSNGNHLIAWLDLRGSNTARFQIFDADGNPVGSEKGFSYIRSHFDVAPLAQGGFVLGYTNGPEGRVIVFDENGILQREVSIGVTSPTNTPIIVSGLASGGFAVTWRDGDSLGARVFDASGTNVLFDLDAATTGTPQLAHVIEQADGTFALIWTQEDSVTPRSPFADGYEIAIQFFSADGSALDGPSVINQSQSGSHGDPKIAQLADGGFVVTWVYNNNNASSAPVGGILAQLFDAQGAPTGENFRVSDLQPNAQSGVYLEALPNGGFVISWNDRSAFSFGEEGRGVRAQVFDADGSRVGLPFKVSEPASGESEDGTIYVVSDTRFGFAFDAAGAVRRDFALPEFGSASRDVFNGTDQTDIYFGGAEFDLISGLGGDDILDGGSGADRLEGGDGNDTLYVGNGSDIAIGGAGDDLYIFSSAAWLTGETSNAPVRISEVEAGDIIDISALFVDYPISPTFIDNQPFSGTAGEVRYDFAPNDPATTLEIDLDGDGISDGTFTVTSTAALRETEQGSGVLIFGRFADEIGAFEVRGTAGSDILFGDRDGTNWIYGSAGPDFIVGGSVPGDRLIFDIDSRPDFDWTIAGQEITLLANTVSNSAGTIETTYSGFTTLDVRITSTLLGNSTIDASGWSPRGASSLDLSIGPSSGAWVGGIIGSAYNDILKLTSAAGTATIDGGDGFDRFDFTASYLRDDTGILETDLVSLLTVDGAITTITTNGRITQITNIEELVVSASFTSNLDNPQLRFDGSLSSTPISFGNSTGNDIFIGSAHDDFFGQRAANDRTDADTFTGGLGADTFDLSRLQSVGGTTITDLAPEDIIIMGSGFTSAFPLTDWLGDAAFTGEAGEFRYTHSNGQTLIELDFTGDGTADAVVTLANGEFALGQVSGNDLAIALPEAAFIGTEGADILAGDRFDNTFHAGDGGDTIVRSRGTDTIDGGENIDTLLISGRSASYQITQRSNGEFTVSGSDGFDVLVNVEYVQFDDATVRLIPGSGVSVNFETADPGVYQDALNAIKDFDGNALGGDGNWLRIGSADVNGDGDIDQILVNDSIARFATVGTADDGLVYFDDHSWAGETRVVGIYIDPLVASGDVEAGSDFDSQRRFQNDLAIENINRVLGADDYDGDGLQEVYLALTDGTAYLHLYMHADGNIQYANYQSQEQVIDFLESNGFGEETYGDWFS